jgi:hypothetical protein
MRKDPTIAIRDCLTEIAILHDIAASMTLEDFRSDPITLINRPILMPCLAFGSRGQPPAREAGRPHVGCRATDRRRAAPDHDPPADRAGFPDRPRRGEEVTAPC